MKLMLRQPATAAVALVLGLAAGVAPAQIYKWTDAEGRVHYGDRQEAAGGKPTQQVKVAPAPPAPQPASAPETPPGWVWPADGAASAASARAARPAAPRVPPSLSGGRENGSDASRCALARDVLNGSLRHANGAPVDQYDRDIARADVQRFCHP